MGTPGAAGCPHGQPSRRGGAYGLRYTSPGVPVAEQDGVALGQGHVPQSVGTTADVAVVRELLALGTFVAINQPTTTRTATTRTRVRFSMQITPGGHLDVMYTSHTIS